jgi:CRISPR type III-B/RAMP module-associated protein Cmr5
MSTQQSIDQKRNAKAWDEIAKIKGRHDKGLESKYRALARGAPADIQTIGLAQTFAFLSAKGEEHHKLLRGQLDRWLKIQVTGNVDVAAWIRKSSTSTTDLMWAAREALSYLVYLKRYAEAELADESDSQEADVEDARQ